MVPRDAVRPPGRPGRWARAGAHGPLPGRHATWTRADPACPGPDDAFDSGIHTWGMCTDAVAADLERPVRAARDGAADPDLAPVRRGPPLVGRPAAPRVARVGPVRDARGDGARRRAPAPGDPRRPRPRGDRQRPSRGPWLPAPRGPRRVPRPGPGSTAARSGMSTGRGVGRMGPLARPRSRAPSRRSSGSPSARRRRSGRSRCGSRARPTSRPARCSTPGSASTGSRGSSAGRGPDHPFDRYLPISLALV